MKRNLLYGFTLLSVLLASCSKEDVLSETDVVEISTQIIPVKSSRVQISDDGTGNFSQSDRITLLVTPENGIASAHELTCTDAGWTPQLTWNGIHADKASFVAIYPTLVHANKEEAVHEVAADQRKKETYQASDLLFAQTVAKRGERVNLDFYHKMCRVTVHLNSKNGAFTEEELASATLTLKAYRQIAIRTQNGELGTVKGNMETITFHHATGSSYHAIVCPQPLLAAWHSEGWIEIEIGKQRLVYKAPEFLNGGTAFEKLESGKQITFNITLDKSETEGGGDEVDWRNKTCWVYGLKNIPPLNQWGYYLPPGRDEFGNPKDEIFALEWKREYGWYDCNKKGPSGPEYGDMNMCWAATCSNMIYWWLEHNAPYLKRYGYHGPFEYKNDLDCEVFQFYKDHFTDNGLHINIGIDWFLCGSSIPTGNNARPTKSHPGFFKDVLKNPVAENVSYGGYDLSKNLKKAFLERKAVGVSVLLNRFTAAHAITIWGAGFDENGEVNVLYVVENNDKDFNTNTYPMRPGIVCNAGIFTKRVKIDSAGKAFIEGGKPGVCSIEIDYLTLLGLHTDEWEAYFNRPENAGK